MPLIQGIVNSEIENLTLDSLKDHIHLYKYEEYDKREDFEIYFLYDQWMDDISPHSRIMLIFSNGVLIAIVHNRELRLCHVYDEHEVINGRKIKYIADIDEKVKTRLKQAYPILFLKGYYP